MSTLDSDKVIEEIRQSRRQMSRQCGHNARRLIRYLKRFDAKYAEQVARAARLRRPISSTR